MAFLVATTSLPAVYRPNGYARTTTPGTPHARAKIIFFILSLFAPPPWQSNSYSERVGVMIMKDMVSGVSGWGVRIFQNLDRLSSGGKNIEYWEKWIVPPISALNYVNFKPNLNLCWSLSLIILTYLIQPN